MENHIFISICEKCNREFNPEEMDDDLEYCSNCILCTNLENLTIDTDVKVLSIDIGIKHLGLSYSLLDDEYKFKKLLWINLIDITIFDCLPDCRLFHTNTLTDRIAHVIHKYRGIFDSANVVLIERQPPQGIIALEQIIFSVFREKAVLISPVAVHKYFHMRDHDYDTRKKISVNIAQKYIGNISQKYSREHDIADTILFTLYWAYTMKEEKEKKRLEDRRKKAMKKFKKGLEMSMEDFFDRFRYIPTGPG